MLLEAVGKSDDNLSIVIVNLANVIFQNVMKYTLRKQGPISESRFNKL